MKFDEFDFLKEAIALRTEVLKVEFRSFASDLERADVLYALVLEAESLGYRIGREGISLPPILSNDRVLGLHPDLGHEHGFNAFVRLQYEAEHCSQKAWDALSGKEQKHYVDEFHSLCAQGIGENCRFYPLLMDRYLHNLVADARAHCAMGSAEVLTNTEIPVDRSRSVVER